MEKKIETTIVGYIHGLYRDYGKENGNYYIMIWYFGGLFESGLWF